MNVGRGLIAAFYIIFGIIWVSSTLSIPSSVGPLFTMAGIIVILLGLRALYRKPKPVGPGAGEDPARNLPESPVEPERHDGESYGFCPYCGSPLEKGFQYCGVCGRRL